MNRSNLVANSPLLRWLGILLAVTAGLKALVLRELGDHPLLQPTGGLDGAVYVELAQRVAGGDLLAGRQAFFVSPLYIYFLAPFVSWGESGLWWAKLFQIGLGTAACGLVFLTARGLGAGTGAWVAAAMLAVTGVVTFNEVQVLQSSLDAFLTALALFALSRGLERGGFLPSLLAGLAFGALVLNRPNALIAAGAVAVTLAVLRPAASLQRAAAFTLGAFVAVAPVTVRNVIVSGGPILVATHGGLNFLIGNNADANGTYSVLPGITPNIAGQDVDARRLAEESAGHPLTAAGVDGHFYGLAFSWLRAEPLAAGRLFLKKLVLMGSSVELPLNGSYAYYLNDASNILRGLFVDMTWLLPLGTLGLVALGRSQPLTRPLVAFAPAYAVSVALFFVASRYRLPLIVVLAIGAGVAVDRLLALAHAKDRRALGQTALIATPLVVIALWPHGLDDGVSDERTEMAVHLVDSGRDEEVAELLTRAEGSHRQPGLLFFRVARAYQDRGRPDKALPNFERARTFDGAQPETELGVGQVLLDLGRPVEAIAHLRSAWQAGYRPDVAGFDLVRALSAAGRHDEAARVVGEVVLPHDASADDHGALGDLAFQLGATEVARSEYDAAFRQQPSSSLLAEKLGLALARLGHNDEAIDKFQTACRLDAGNASAHLNLAVVLAQVGRTSHARAAAEEALRLRPDYVQAQGLLRAIGGRK